MSDYFYSLGMVLLREMESVNWHQACRYVDNVWDIADEENQ